jgi:dephospho-CoA kinase
MHNILVSFVLALTGNIACGKSLAGEIFKKRGIPVIDSDDIVHELYASDQKVQSAVLREFGTLERKQIAQLIFGDSNEHKAKRKILESIIHPAVDKYLRRWVKDNNKHPILIHLIPLVFEAGLEERYNAILLIGADEGIQRERLRKRNPDLSEEDITKRLKSQMPQAEKIKKADYVIFNNYSKEDLEEQIIKLLQEISGS